MDATRISAAEARSIIHDFAADFMGSGSEIVRVRLRCDSGAIRLEVTHLASSTPELPASYRGLEIVTKTGRAGIAL